MFDGTTGGGDDAAPAGGFLSRLNAGIGQPFAAPVTWGRLFLVVGFVLVAMIAWRQVILYIAGEK